MSKYMLQKYFLILCAFWWITWILTMMIQVGWIIERFIFEIANTIFVDYLCIDIPKLITHAFKALWWLYEDIQFFFFWINEKWRNEGKKWDLHKMHLRGVVYHINKMRLRNIISQYIVLISRHLNTSEFSNKF